MTDSTAMHGPKCGVAVGCLLPVLLSLFTGQAIGQIPATTSTAASDEITVTGRVSASTIPLAGGRDFISPMGEPFRSSDVLSGAEHWFRQVDLNHNGHLSLLEFRSDASRFFATLDTDHDGEIGPIEIDHYENDVAPEVKVMSSYGDPSLIKTDQDGTVTDAPYPTRLGAGRFGYLAMPEPVAYADLNFDRAVTRHEFDQAAAIRFKMLDTNGDGTITRDELPRLHAPRDDDVP